MHRSGEAEVRDPHPAVLADQDVLRLEVAVDDAGLVRGGEPRARGEVEGEHPLRPQRAGRCTDRSVCP